VREREVDSFVRAHPDLGERVAEWRERHPVGSLRDAVIDLDLWPRAPGPG
jgi:hypothetical protein